MPLAGSPAEAGSPLRRPRRGAFHGLFAEVTWTPAFIGLLIYVFSVVTYRLPLATPGIVLALAGVLLGSRRVRLPPVLLAFGAFLLWGLVSYTQSPYPAVVWERLILMGKLWLVAFALVNAVRTPAHVRFFMVFFLVCFATHPARGAIINYFSGYTVFGRALWNHIYANPNDLAALTLFPLGLAIALIRDSDRWVRRGAAVSVVVLTLLVLMTQSRGAFLALALVGLLILLSLGTQRRKLRTMGVVALVAVAGVLLAPSGVWERVGGLGEGTEADTSSRQRWEIWHVAREISADNEVYGVGLGAYRYAHSRYTRDDPRYQLAGGARDTHSTYLNVLAETGWPGLLLFLVMVGIPLNEARRARRKLRHHAAAALVGAVSVVLLGYLAAGIFATVPHHAFLYLHLAFLSVISRDPLARLRRQRRRTSPMSPTPAPWSQREWLRPHSPSGSA